jgi:hypothetical protein
MVLDAPESGLEGLRDGFFENYEVSEPPQGPS